MAEQVLIEHPLTDVAGPGWQATELTSPVVWLSVSLADWLRRVALAGDQPILVTAERARLTEPLFEILNDLDGHWVVRTNRGTFYDARRGAKLAEPQAVRDQETLAEEQLADEFRAPPTRTRMRMVVSFSTRHRTTQPILLGGTTADIAESVGCSLSAYGPTEPVVAPWNRRELTEISRTRMPDETRWIAIGEPESPMIATIKAARTVAGVEETARLNIDMGPVGDPRHRLLGDLAARALTAGTKHGMPLLGFAFAHIGAEDLARQPFLEPSLQPLALLIGAPGLRQFAVPTNKWMKEYGAKEVGKPRIPSLFIPLGDADESGWARLQDIVEQIGPERLFDVGTLTRTTRNRPPTSGDADG